MTPPMRPPAVVICVVVVALFAFSPAFGARSTAIRGAHRDDQSGTAIAGAGDVNGDGLDDLLVSSAGSVYVVFGRHSRKPIKLGRLGRGGFRIVGSRRSDLGLLNGSVAGVGDQNGDGLADVLVADDHGYVVYGKRGSAPVDLRRLGAGGYRLGGDAFSVANAGDVNGDGRNDFIIGDKELDAGNSPPGGARVDFSAAPGAPVDPGAPTGFDLVSEDRGDFAGLALAGAGDVNGDGLADVMVAAPNGGPGGADAHGNIEGDISGRVYVVYGKRDGAPVDLQSLGGQGFTILDSRRPEDGGAVGNSVAGVGDVNGDGKADVAEAGNQQGCRRRLRRRGDRHARHPAAGRCRDLVRGRGPAALTMSPASGNPNGTGSRRSASAPHRPRNQDRRGGLHHVRQQRARGRVAVAPVGLRSTGRQGRRRRLAGRRNR